MTRSTPPQQVPTLTEVVPPRAESVPALPAAVADRDRELVSRVLAELQPEVDRLLDARIRAALEPLLQQTLARIVEETRREVASSLHECVAKTLAEHYPGHRN